MNTNPAESGYQCACCTPVDPPYQEEIEILTTSESDEQVKTMVRDKYAALVEQGGASSCCGDSSVENVSIIGNAYEGVEGYVEDADLSLGCGVPTELAGIQKNDTVLDLGSGAGLDVFVARRHVGEEGTVLGVDMTPAMVEKARENARKLDFQNVHFVQGDIDSLPIDSDTVDVVISNCVLNLVPDKRKAFSEMYRVIRPGGHFCVSDIVVRGEMPDGIRRSAALYAGCVAGAVTQAEYISWLGEAGFKNVRIKLQREIQVPDDVLLSAVDSDTLERFRSTGGAIMSITVYGEKEV